MLSNHMQLYTMQCNGSKFESTLVRLLILCLPRFADGAVSAEGLMVSCGDHVSCTLYTIVLYTAIQGVGVEDRHEYRVPIHRVIMHPSYGVGTSTIHSIYCTI